MKVSFIYRKQYSNGNLIFGYLARLELEVMADVCTGRCASLVLIS